jgi:uncharacterized protein YecE (DUF72 family)
MADQAVRVHVLMNNCYRDYAVRNARQLAALLAQFGEFQRVPELRVEDWE